MTQPTEPAKHSLLRQGAESRPTSQSVELRADTGDLPKLLQELQVQQIALEMQNEQLRRAEDALRDSERRYRLLSDGASECMIWIGPNGDVRYASPTCQTLFGNAPEQFIVDPGLLARGVHPDDRQAFLKHIEEVQPHIGKTALEYRVMHRDGSEQWVAHHCQSLYDERGDFMGRRSSIWDISERKRAELALSEQEAQYRAVIETAVDGFWMLDEEGRLLAVNDAYVRRSGYSRAELLTMCIANLEAQESPEQVRAHIEKVRCHGNDQFESLQRTKDGEIWPVEVVCAYWAAAGGRFFAFLRDITERRRSEAAAHATNDELERLMRFHVAGQTAAAIAHELNQPLNAVASFNETALRLLRADTLQMDKLHKALESSAQQAQRAGRVLRELLAFIGKDQAPTEPVDLNDTVNKVLARMEAEGQERFHVKLELEPNLPPVRANRLQVEKVLTNLVENGIEAMRDGGINPHAITVTISTFGDGSMARATVRDNGPGISAQIVGRIFDPFFTTKARGLGMGLPLSRAIIEAHGGQLWVESDTGSGARFHFTLPFAT